MEIPRVVIAGTHSGCGKTTVARGIMDALSARGLVVQPFKVGPDFIDPTHHTRICGRISRNLDSFMMPGGRLGETFCTASQGADIAVIEGVMGLFDGIDGTEAASTSDVARILGAPVVLVADVRGMSRSVHAVIRGFSGFSPGTGISGVIFNRVGSPRHRSMIGDAAGVTTIGAIPRVPELGIASRHLGLHMAGEVPENPGGEIIAESCDLDALLALARSAAPVDCPTVETPDSRARAAIGVARDAAFCFYYEDNLDALRAAGADLVFFSPMEDRLPCVDAVYLGGGYPELHAPALEASACRTDLAGAIPDGMPVFGECGGLLYLTGEIVADGTHRMVGALPGRAVMTGRIAALGYTAGCPDGGPRFVATGGEFRGHEFHYSRVDCGSDARFSVRLSRGKGILDGMDGMFEHNAAGMYTHSYFTRKFAAAFVDAAEAYRRS